MSVIAQVENAIVERLRGRLPYLRTCGSLSGFLGRDPGAVGEMAPLCPAALVFYEHGGFISRMPGVLDREMVFGVIVAVRNLRGDSAVRRGAAGEKGAYDLLEDVRDALSDETCGMPVDPLAPVSEEAVGGSLDLVAYEILFRTKHRTVKGEE